jgi:hypothetical protein
MSLTRGALLAVLVVGTLACGSPSSEPPPTDVPPTDIDLTIAVEDLPGWAEVKASIDEPPESTRLETFLEFFRETIDAVRRNPDPVERQEEEDGWWAEAERGLVSMVGPEHAQTVLRWMETTFLRRRGDGS